MSLTADMEKVHQAIGELVVFFQSIEDEYRRIGWYLVDPEQTEWPPGAFRKESNADLIDKVTNLFVDLTRQYKFPNGEQKTIEAEELRKTFHALRKFRNRVVHSAYHEVIADGQVAAILRTSPKITVDPDTGEIEYDQEDFDTNTICKEIGRHVQAFFILHTIRKQLIHWYPFSRFQRDT